MNITTTPKDLLLYAYNETDLKDSDRIQRSIDGDPLVQEEFNEITSALSLLEGSSVKPADSTIRKILDFAKTAG
jgi:hypothetical protein